jgi:DNA-binding LytR/AlgR family response regulator
VPVPCTVLECIDSIEDTVEWFENNPPPDLLFLDIQLSDGLSFEIFNRVEIKTPVVFTTAFDEYAIRAFKVNSIDYLLKPVKLDALTEAIEKYKALVDQFGGEKQGLDLEQVKNLLEIHKPQFKTRFIAKVGDQIKHVEIEEVAYFKAEDNEVMLITKENNRYIIDYSLDQLSGLLNPDAFFRVNRAYIISPKAIEKISKYFNSRLHLELIPAADENVLISRVKVPEFLEWMDK